MRRASDSPLYPPATTGLDSAASLLSRPGEPLSHLALTQTAEAVLALSSAKGMPYQCQRQWFVIRLTRSCSSAEAGRAKVSMFLLRSALLKLFWFYWCSFFLFLSLPYWVSRWVCCLPLRLVPSVMSQQFSQGALRLPLRCAQYATTGRSIPKNV